VSVFDYNQFSLIGYGKSTIAAIDFLRVNFPSARIRVSELKSEQNFSAEILSGFKLAGVEFEFGAQSPEFIGFQGECSKLFIMISPGIPPQSSIIKEIDKLCQNPDIDCGTDLDIFSWFVGHSYIGITGTNGKTTTTSFIAHALGNQAVGNIGKPFLEFTSAGKGHGDCFSAEISSFQLFYSNFVTQPEYRPQVSVHLNLTDDHLDWHKDLSEYKNSKEKLFRIPEPSEKQEFTWVLNYDDDTCNALGKRACDQLKTTGARNLDIAYFSTKRALTDLNPYNRTSAFWEDGSLYLAKYLEPGGDDSFGGIVESNAEGHYYVKVPVIKTSELNLVGEHNYSNLLAGILAVLAVGVPLETVISALKSFTAVKHRLEFIGELKGHKFFNDSKATNPDSANKALEAFEKSIVICGGKNKNLDLSGFIDKLSQKAFAVVLIGELAPALASGLDKKGFSQYAFAQDMDSAVIKALDFGNNSSLPIVLAPASSSFDMYKNYEERGDKFRESFLAQSRKFDEVEFIKSKQ
jgi:UDP-N-acetylmuramoylalanine--D-glutamate ligase